VVRNPLSRSFSLNFKLEVLVALERVEDVDGSETHDKGTILPGRSGTKSTTSQESRPMSTGDQTRDIANLSSQRMKVQLVS